VPLYSGWEAFQSPDGCDLSRIVAAFDPARLEITCQNFGELELGEVFAHGSYRNVRQASWRNRTLIVKQLKFKKSTGISIQEKATIEAALMDRLEDAD
jgi:hypothetical protein